MISTQERRKSDGVCVGCGDVDLATKTRCKVCAEKMRGYNATVYRERKARGQCVRCGYPAIVPGKTCCDTCLLEGNEAKRGEVLRLQGRIQQLQFVIIALCAARKGKRNDSSICD